MKIAIVTPEPPFPPSSGGRLRVQQHIAALHGLAHEVTVIAFDDPQDADSAPGEEARTLSLPREGAGGKALRFARATLWAMHPRLLRITPALPAFMATLRRAEPDLVILEHSLLAALLPVARSSLPGVPVVVDAHNAETRFLKELLSVPAGLQTRVRHLLELRAMARLERDLLPSADEVWVPSKEDAAALQEMGTLRLVVVPNAVDTDAYQPGSSDAEGRLVFTGMFSHLPNVEAAALLCASVLPKVAGRVPAAHLYLVGKHHGPIAHLATPRVTVTGSVPDVRPYLEAAAVVMVPLRHGAGTRVKILEAFAMGKAVVSTHKGCEGLEVVDGTHLLIADDPDAFADRVVVLLQDPVLRHRLGTAARALVERSYSWRAVQDLLAIHTIAGRVAASR